MPRITTAISIRQPYVELILRRKKEFEYRTQPTTKKNTRVYLYAAATPADDAAAWRDVGLEPGELPVRLVLGSVVIEDCYWNARYKCYVYVLKAPKRLKRPRSPKNAPQPVFWAPRFNGAV